MAVIGRIRKHSGLIVVVIGIALAAFVLGDFLKPGKRYRRQNYIGEVAGENINYNEFAQKVEEQVEIYSQLNNTKLTNDQIFEVRQYTWSQMLRDIILGKQSEKLGLSVSTDELSDIIQGKNPHQLVVQYIQRYLRQEYSPQLVNDLIKNLDDEKKVSPEIKKSWLFYEKLIKDERRMTKYNNLIAKGYYLPAAFAKYDYNDKNRRYDIRIVSLPYQTVDDKTITLTEDDYKKYYEENKKKYESEASRDLDYVLFEIKPSKNDRDSIANQVTAAYDAFTKSTDIAAVYKEITGTELDSSWYKPQSLPARIDSVLFASPAGTFIPPFIENNAYSMAKLLEIQVRPDSMKASHILISYQGAQTNDNKITRSKEKAKAVADSIFGELQKNIGQFSMLAGTLSDDPGSKKNGGDLGYFVDGTMVKPFNEAVVNGNVGEMKIVETVYGYHLILITDKKAFTKKIRVAMINTPIEASGYTTDSIRSMASDFVLSSQNITEFESTAKAKGYAKRVAERIEATASTLPGLKNSREVIRWAYAEETEKGDVSTVYTIEGNYLVAALKEIREKGIPSLEQLKPTIEPLVKRDKKAEILIDKAKKASSQDLYQLAVQLKSKVDTVKNVIFFSGNLPQFGPEPAVVGTISTLKIGNTSPPLKGEQGVYIVRLDSIAEPPAIKDYKMVQNQAVMGFSNRVQGMAYKTLEKMSDVLDNRVRFY